MSRKVAVYEYVQEWIWRHSCADRVTRYVLLAIGRHMQHGPDGYETPPVKVEDIAESTGLWPSAVRENLKILGHESGDLEIVRGRRRGETYRYRLRREQLLPLTDLTPPHRREQAMKITDPPPPRGDDSAPVAGDDDASASAGIRRSHRRQLAVAPPVTGGAPAGGVLSFQEVQVPSTTAAFEVPVPFEAAADFLRWFEAEYQTRRGCPYRDVNTALAMRRVSELLTAHGADRLRAMAILMFDAVRDKFITGSDYSLHVLHHKASYLAVIAIRNEVRQ